MLILMTFKCILVAVLFVSRFPALITIIIIYIIIIMILNYSEEILGKKWLPLFFIYSTYNLCISMFTFCTFIKYII